MNKLLLEFSLPKLMQIFIIISLYISLAVLDGGDRRV